jgi:heme o synthase
VKNLVVTRDAVRLAPPFEPVEGFAPDIPAKPSTSWQRLLARFARQPIVRSPQRVRNSRLSPHNGLVADGRLARRASLASAVTRALADYVALTKPRLNLLVVASSAAGYYLGARAPFDVAAMVQAVGGTALVAAGAAALNQFAERDIDAMMRRTRTRPLPSGRLSPWEALAFGLALFVTGLAVLALTVTMLATMLAFVTLVVYLGVYTPMKRRTPLSTLVGAVPGALPPLIGWSASHGTIAGGGAALFAIVFLWQIPHFMAIAWLFRDDYDKAGLPVLPVLEPDGHRTGRTAVVYAAALIPISLLPWLIGMTGLSYAAVAAAVGLGLLWLAIRFAIMRSNTAARSLFLGSIIYLPVLWIVMIADRI